MTDIFAVIADPTRRDLLGVLLDRRAASASGAASVGGSGAASAPGDISVGEMVRALGVSQPTVSKHLRVLRDAGLVHVREVGQHRYYSVDDGPLREIGGWLEPFFASDTSAPAALLRTVETVSRVPRAGSGAVPAPLRRAAENLPDVGDVGATLGRAVAGAQSRILDPVKKRLSR